MAKDKPLPQAGPELAEYTTAAQPKAYADGVPVFCAHDAIIPLKDLRPNPKNPNQHPPEQIKLLLASIIRATGWRGPITVSKRSGYIVKGHGRMMAAELGDMSEVPVDYQDYASEAEELADLTADNRIAELATTDNKLLAEVFADIDTGEIPFMLSGYTEEDYGNIVTALSEALHTEEPKGDPDAEIPPPAEPVTKYGDLWILGRHRVLCGDCTHPEDRALLLDGAKPEILLTDPPLLLRRPEGGAEVDRQHRHRAQGRQGPEDRQRHPQHPGLPKPDPGGPHRHPVPLCLHLHRLENVGVPVRPRRGCRLRRQVGARMGQGHAGHGRRLALTA